MDTEPTPPPIVNEDAVRQTSLESLLVFLDNHDANCPECGYSLCGIKSVNCPECGWVITLRPSDGIDRQRVVQATRWIAYIGLTISVGSIAHIVVMLLRTGVSLVSTWQLTVYVVGDALLLAVCLFSLVTLRRRTKRWATKTLLIRTKLLFFATAGALIASDVVAIVIDWTQRW